MNEQNTVLLSIASYNQLKAENVRHEMLLERLMYCAGLSEDHQKLTFKSEDVAEALEFTYLERTKKKIANLKAQKGMYGAPEGTENDDKTLL